MISVRLYSNHTDLNYEVPVNADLAYKILELLEPKVYPSRDEFIRRYVDRDLDYDDDVTSLMNK